MKKLVLLFVLAIVSVSFCEAQSLSPTVIASGGDFYSNSTGSLSWTLGESAVDFLSTSSNSLSQGFQQSNTVITLVQNQIQDNFAGYVFPNPVKDLLNVRLESPSKNTYKLYLMDMLGRVQNESTVSGSGNLSTEIDMQKLAAGMYFLHIYSSDKQIKTFKIEKIN